MVVRAKKSRLRWIVAVGLVLMAGTGAWALLRPTPPAPVPNVLSITDGGYLYTYHVLSRTEALFDVTDDPKRLRNLSRTRPNETALLRGKLANRLGVAALDEYGGSSENTLRAKLKSLGYMR